ncbi:MAG: DUF1553 domain-containing protein [Planctomycetes bacterium]|nr:DUF1553 domain-containing protein [Planctomycetota bacterium]
MLNDDGWSKNPIDKFIIRKLQREGLRPAVQADRRTLIRRAGFDLVGLPPSSEDVEAFVNDSDVDAYEKLVDRLLGSPHYGEQWARHWLDLVRYAESDGWKSDHYRPDAWRYRDYVIRSFNEDKPYDRFVMEQLAGDEIAPDDPDVLVATGMLRLGIYEYNQKDVRTHWSEMLNEITDVTGEVFLGLGMSCARCHDHKFDPIMQKDYYRLQAFFTPLLFRDDQPLVSTNERLSYQRQLGKWEEATQEIREKIAELEKPHLEKAKADITVKFPPDIQQIMKMDPAQRTAKEQQIAHLAHRQIIYEQKNAHNKIKGEGKVKWGELKKELGQFDHLKPKALPKALTVSDVGAFAPATTIEGDDKNRDIKPGFLSVLHPEAARIGPLPFASNSTGRRTALAEWITRPENPLTTRVIVNRIWQYHFGQGLVPMASDFGNLSDPPSHPELLDWLANEFVRSGWSFKAMHRMIMNSATYQQSSEHRELEKLQRVDPDNRLLAKMSRRRLQAEQIRDAILSVTGELDLKMAGASVDASTPRRSIYTKVKRNTPDPMLAAFDGADGFSSTSRRYVTTTPAQSLLMFNNQWPLDRANALSLRLLESHPVIDDKLIEDTFGLVYGRSPKPSEIEDALGFIQEQKELFLQDQPAPAVGESSESAPKGLMEDARLAALGDFCHVLINSNEFIYIE